MKIIRENMGTVIRGRDKVIEKERKRQSCEGKKMGRDKHRETD